MCMFTYLTLGAENLFRWRIQLLTVPRQLIIHKLWRSVSPTKVKYQDTGHSSAYPTA